MDALPNPCVQLGDCARAIAAFDADTLPAKESLHERALWIQCFQLVRDYKAMTEGRVPEQPNYLGRGVGTNMLKKLIDWARVEGWELVRSQAVPHIPPLMIGVGIVSFICRHILSMRMNQGDKLIAVSDVPRYDRHWCGQLTISVNGHMLLVAIEAFGFAFAPETGVGIRRASSALF